MPQRRTTPHPIRSAPTPQAATSWLDEIDAVAAVRGSSAGFTVLVLGGLIAPALAARVPGIGSLALVLTAIAGFTTAAARQGSSSRPIVQGVIAAVGAYALVLPLVGMVSRHWDVAQIAVTLGVAIVVGAIVGPVSLRVSIARTTSSVGRGASR